MAGRSRRCQDDLQRTRSRSQLRRRRPTQGHGPVVQLVAGAALAWQQADEDFHRRRERQYRHWTRPVVHLVHDKAEQDHRRGQLLPLRSEAMWIASASSPRHLPPSRLAELRSRRVLAGGLEQAAHLRHSQPCWPRSLRRQLCQGHQAAGLNPRGLHQRLLALSRLRASR